MSEAPPAIPHARASVATREWIGWFYREHHRALAAYAVTLTRSRDEAEDLVHEALAGMLATELRIGGSAAEPARGPTCGWIEHPEAYAYRAIRNRAIDRARRPHRVDASASVEAVPRDSADPHDWGDLRRALGALAPAAAEVVVLHTRSGLSFPQIARVLDEPVGTVSARDARALAEMRAMLAKEGSHG